MNIVALLVLVITALASLGVASWAWHAMASGDGKPRDRSGYEPIRYAED